MKGKLSTAEGMRKGRSLLETPSDGKDSANGLDRERAEVERLLAELEQESRGRYPVFHVGCLVALGAVLGMFSLCSTAALPWLGISSLVCGGLFLLLLSYLTVSARQKQLLSQLRSFQDVRLAGPFLTALYWPGMEEHRTSMQIALTALLPRMRASDAHLLSRQHRLILYRTLRSGEDTFVIAILKALEQIGTAEAIPHVERLARRRVWTPRQKQIKEAADACLPMLYARTSKSGERLLRPATTSDPLEETLLRPASGGKSEAETLLRPDVSRQEERGIDADTEEKRSDTDTGDQTTE